MDRRHGPRLLALGGELWWATAWMDEANDVFGPLLGLPELPVVDLPAGDERFRRRRLVLEDEAPGRARRGTAVRLAG